jgi:cysteine-rich repeat protein
MITRFRRLPPLFINLALALFLAAPWATTAMAASSADGFWRDIDQNRITAVGQRHTVPERYRTLELTISAFESALALAPPEKSPGGGVLISLPMPDGSFQQFLVENSPVMAPQLAQMHPEITTYLAVAEDNAATTARLDLTPAGFHAMVFRPEGTVYIDPYQTGSALEYISYYKRELQNSREPFYCGVTGQPIDAPENVPDHNLMTPVGDVLKTYRLAVAATGEYTSFHGGTAALGLAAVVTTINRVSGIYERELSVRLSLVANNISIIYTNPATDPYTNTNPFALLDENQANVDAVIGSANYDIGHVFSTGGGGLAGLGVVCNVFAKAQGETGLGTPVGDPFDVDFVAHEIGHQFGGNHTFNGTTSNCGGGNRNASTAYEPGSGSTIQAYAGICGAENLQAHSDDYFHTISFDEMISYITGGGNCASPSDTGNTVPTIDAGAGFTVPAGTSLLLRADNAADPDAGQVLTYSWEQLDLGNAGPPNTDNGNRPIFRSFPPHATPVRYLPRMADILANSSTLGESMPTTDRPLTFRLTVRDNAAGGGGVDYATVVHQVTTSAGPFVVTSQNTPVTWPGGSAQIISWDVANTTAEPVNCANVDIIFSESEFADFSGITLVTGTPNDGSETITAPLEASSGGRVMVMCQSNIFFDVNDAAITVSAPGECGDSILDFDEQCDDGNTTGGDGCSMTCQVEDGWSCSLPVPPVADTNVLPEGGFEGGVPSPAWTEASDHFGTPICSTASCVGPGSPNSGSWYAWFGGVSAAETGSVEQDFVIEEANTELTLARRLSQCDSASDFVRLLLDGNVVWQRDGADPACGELNYFTETVDLASAPGGPYNDGLSHLIRIESSIFASNFGASNFFIDDVSILGGASPAQPSECIEGSFRIGGVVSGLAGSGLVLQNNAGDDLAIGADGGFTFATPLVDGSAYEVTVLTQPGGLSQTCTLDSGVGTLAGADVDNVVVTCVTDTFTIGGAVSGLAGSGLVLQNNAGDDLAIGADGGFTFAMAVPMK